MLVILKLTNIKTEKTSSKHETDNIDDIEPAIDECTTNEKIDSTWETLVVTPTAQVSSED